MITITFYKDFHKRINSTKRPAGGSQVNVRLKDSVSILHPVFLIDGIDLDVNYIKWEDRYYYVDDIIIGNNYIYEIHCSIDYLATYRSEIYSTTAYVEYASYRYDSGIPDTRISTVDDVSIAFKTATVFGSDSGYTSDYGSVGITCVNDDTSIATGYGMGFYFLSQNGAGLLTKALYNGDQTFIDNLNKVFADAFSSITSIKWIPFDLYSQSTATSKVRLGSYDLVVDIDGVQSNIYAFKPTSMAQCRHDYTWSIDIPWLYNDWRNMSPYTEISIFLPYVGMIQLPVNDYIGRDQAKFRTIVDYVSGQITYHRLKVNGQIEDTYTGNLGVDIQIGQQAVDAIKQGFAAIGAMGSLTNANIGGAISGMIDSYVANNQRHLSVAGSSGGSIATSTMTGGSVARLNLYSHNTNIDPSNIVDVQGGPLREVVTLSSIPGYVKTAGASVNISGMMEEKEYINNALDSGVFLE